MIAISGFGRPGRVTTGYESTFLFLFRDKAPSLNSPITETTPTEGRAHPGAIAVFNVLLREALNLRGSSEL